MCAQIDVLKKIRKKGKVNGYDVDLAEAQAKDYVTMKQRVEAIESDVSSIKNTLVEHGTKLDLLLKEVRSSQEDAGKYRLLVDIWRTLFGSTKKTITTFIIVGVIIGLVNMKDVLELLRVLI